MLRANSAVVSPIVLAYRAGYRFLPNKFIRKELFLSTSKLQEYVVIDCDARTRDLRVFFDGLVRAGEERFGWVNQMSIRI